MYHRQLVAIGVAAVVLVMTVHRTSVNRNWCDALNKFTPTGELE